MTSDDSRPDYDGPAVIEWQANGSTTFAEPVTVRATALDDGWQIRMHAPFDVWWFLLGFDNPFRLVLPDGSTFDVGLGRPDLEGIFPLWEWSADGEHLDACHGCGGAGWHVTVNEAGDALSVVDRCPGCGSERRHEYRRPDASGA